MESRAFSRRHEWKVHLNEHKASPDQMHTCPLCQLSLTSDNEWHRHVGREMQQLALFALPKHLYRDDSDMEQDQPVGDSDEASNPRTEVGWWSDRSDPQSLISTGAIGDALAQDHLGDFDRYSSGQSTSLVNDRDASAPDQHDQRQRTLKPEPQSDNDLDTVPNVPIERERKPYIAKEGKGKVYGNEASSRQRTLKPDPQIATLRDRNSMSPEASNLDHQSNTSSHANDYTTASVLRRSGPFSKSSRRDRSPQLAEHVNSDRPQPHEYFSSHEDYQASRSSTMSDDKLRSARPASLSDASSQGSRSPPKTLVFGTSNKDNDPERNLRPSAVDKRVASLQPEGSAPIAESRDTLNSAPPSNAPKSHLPKFDTRSKGIKPETPKAYFTAVTGASRPCTNEEQWVCYYFEAHAATCDACMNPAKVQRAGRQLCRTGHGLAIDVAGIFTFRRRDGGVYSRVKPGEHDIRVELPYDYEQTLSLLKAVTRAVENGERFPPKLRSKDKSYFVEPRIAPGRTQEASSKEADDAGSLSMRRIKVKEPNLPRPAPKSRRRERETSDDLIADSKRGSLYSEDMRRLGGAEKRGQEIKYNLEVRDPKFKTPRRPLQVDEEPPA